MGALISLETARGKGPLSSLFALRTLEALIALGTLVPLRALITLDALRPLRARGTALIVEPVDRLEICSHSLSPFSHQDNARGDGNSPNGASPVTRTADFISTAVGVDSDSSVHDGGNPVGEIDRVRGIVDDQ